MITEMTADEIDGVCGGALVRFYIVIGVVAVFGLDFVP